MICFTIVKYNMEQKSFGHSRNIVAQNPNRKSCIVEARLYVLSNEKMTNFKTAG
jgi:hypothetical protein